MPQIDAEPYSFTLNPAAVALVIIGWVAPSAALLAARLNRRTQ
jgi:hypothetical protein